MFPPSTTHQPNKRSLRELLRAAAETALEFATLGEASFSAEPVPAPAEPPAPAASHPHRRPASRRPRARRPGGVSPRAQLCTAPLAAARRSPARHPAAATAARQS
ncbi:MAG TPA: hypothetical protein VF533_23880 [Solirubrobacteraceae bacterium]|jgi:hypothetical protein